MDLSSIVDSVPQFVGVAFLVMVGAAVVGVLQPKKKRRGRWGGGGDGGDGGGGDGGGGG